MKSIAEHIKKCRGVLAVEIKALHDSKLPSDEQKEKKLTKVFIFLSKTLANNNTDEKLTMTINQKIIDNESAIGGLLAALEKDSHLNFESLIVDFNAENEFYRAILAPSENKKPGHLHGLIVDF